MTARTPRKPPKAPSWAKELLRAAQALPSVQTGYDHPQRPDRPAQDAYPFPELPPGVLPGKTGALAMDKVCTGEVRRETIAMDGGFAPTWGFGGAGFAGGFWFPGYPYLAELTQISEYRQPCEIISTEMTRKWFELQSKGASNPDEQDEDDKQAADLALPDPAAGADKPDDEEETDENADPVNARTDEKNAKDEKISKIMARLEELKVRDCFRRAALQDCFFGRSQIYININDADDGERQLPIELTPESIPKGSLKSIQTVEPYWTTPYSWNASYPERKDFYKPVSWYFMGRKTHATRVLTFIGREVPDLLKPAYNFGGMSLIQLGELSVNMWLRTRKAVNDLINNFSIPVLSTNLQATLQDAGEVGGGLMARIQAFTLLRNNQSVAAIQMGEEELKFAEATLASLDKLQAQSQEHLAAVWGIPLVKLTGITPSGLNASSEGEIQVWYDRISAMQQQLFEPNLTILLKIVQLDLFGEIDDDLTIHWVSLDEPTAKELSEIRKSDADAGVGYINAGVISPEEERERLQNDPLSGYENLTGPAPEPMPDPGMEMQLGHEADQADQARQHEADQADKSREHETGKAVLAAAAKPKPAPPGAKK
jgi:phage-related protein (TIGR01555 family)